MTGVSAPSLILNVRPDFIFAQGNLTLLRWQTI